MKIKKFIAATMPEAMNQIRKELGPDAVILNSRELRDKRFFGLFTKKKIEVIAGLDPQPSSHSDPVHKYKDFENHGRDFEISERLDESHESQPKIIDEIKQLKTLLEHQAFQSEHQYPPEYEYIYQYLKKQEINEEYCKQLITHLLESNKEMKERPSTNKLIYLVQQEIVKRLRSVPFEGITYDKKIVQFVGPTGVGKTTTLAKVAANSILKDGKKVAFITADTYRIAAIEQLKTYAKILDVPLEVAYSIEDYNKYIEKFSSYDLILVDTAGRNFRDKSYVDELRKTIDFNTNIETFLVLSVTAKTSDMNKIYEQFRHLSIHKVIFTKIDETDTFGNILNMAFDQGLGIAYMTNGQNVPDDLLKPTPEKISEFIVGRYEYE